MPKKSNQRREDGRIAVQIYIGKDENGKRKYKTVYGTTQKEASQKAEELKSKLNKGIDITCDTDTFSAWRDRWLACRQPNVDESTYKTDKARSAYFLDAIGAVPLKNISVYAVQMVLNQIAAKNPHTGKPTAKKTLGYIRNIVISVFEFAVENRATEYNPAKYTKLPQGAPKSTRRALTKEERQRIIDTPHRAQTAAMIAMLAGLRRGELTALTWNDVDLTAGKISVTKSYDFKSERLKSTKTEAGVRTVPIPKILSDYLRTVKKVSPYVVTTAGGHMMTNDAWRRLWESYITEINVKYGYNGKISKYNPKSIPILIEPFTIHSLRHTYCTILYESGIDVLVAKELMGHADIQTTLGIYTHLDQQKKDRSIDRLDAFLQSASQMQVKNA